MAFVEKRVDLFAASSTTTTAIYWLGDAEWYSLSVANQGSNSTDTIQGSNADGRSTGLPLTAWISLLTFQSSTTTVIDSVVHNLPRVRWLRYIRSNTTNVILALRERYR